MTVQQEISRRLKAHPLALRGESSDTFDQMLALCESPLARPLDEGIVVNPAEEIRRIWATRLRIAAAKQRTIEGAQALVEALDLLSPEHGVEQMAVEAGRRVGIVFFDGATQEPLGAVLKRWTEEDAADSHANFELAAGVGEVLAAKEAVVPPSRRERAAAR
jgi:hypothetical protein